MFAAGERVDVVGVSKGKGFAGVMKRHGFGGLGASHGTERKHRSPGSIGACATPAACSRACGWPASMGNQRVTVLNLEVVQADAEREPAAREGRGPRPERRPRDGAQSAVKAPAAEGRRA